MEKLPVWIGPFGDQPVDHYAKGGTYLPTSLDKVYLCVDRAFWLSARGSICKRPTYLQALTRGKVPMCVQSLECILTKPCWD